MQLPYSSSLIRALRRLWGTPGGERGQAMVEFAFVAPAFIAIVGGILEFSGIMFVQSILEGGARAASRYGITGSTVPGVTREERIEAILEEHSFGIIDVGRVQIDTLVYDSFADIGQPEPFTDENANEAYDDGEPFTDVNGNGAWDEDMGAAGLGGPDDVVLYRVSYDWSIIIPLFRPLFGDAITLRSNIAVRNEPFVPPAGGA